MTIDDMARMRDRAPASVKAFSSSSCQAWNGRAIGMKTFGSSAPLKDLQEKFGFTPERG
jgi:transketolase